MVIYLAPLPRGILFATTSAGRYADAAVFAQSPYSSIFPSWLVLQALHERCAHAPTQCW